MNLANHAVRLCNLWIRRSKDKWSSGYAFVSGAEGMRFKFRTGQIGHSIAKSSPSLRHFSNGADVLPGRNDAKVAPQTRVVSWAGLFGMDSGLRLAKCWV